MAKPQHRTPEYQRAYRELRRKQAAGMTLWCNEVECVYPTRYLYPDQKAAVLHDPSGTVIIGVGHHKCNAREAAIRGNAMRRAPRLHARWPL